MYRSNFAYNARKLVKSVCKLMFLYYHYCAYLYSYLHVELPLTDRCLSVKTKIGVALLLQEYFNYIQHHCKLAEEQHTVTLKQICAWIASKCTLQNHQRLKSSIMVVYTCVNTFFFSSTSLFDRNFSFPDSPKADCGRQCPFRAG